MEQTNTCTQCECLFVPHRKSNRRQKFCSRRCYDIARYLRHKVERLLQIRAHTEANRERVRANERSRRCSRRFFKRLALASQLTSAIKTKTV